MIMELCSGTLRNWIKSRNQSNDSIDNRLQLYTWMQQICEGLLHIHEGGDQGILHRDLKPENILLSDNNTLKISDLGLATDNPYDTHTERVGTKLYRPQEQQGKDYGKEVDFYPLGNKTLVNMLLIILL